MCNTPLALAALVVKKAKDAVPEFLLVASRPGRGEPCLLLTNGSPLTWEGEDGVAEFLCLPSDLETEVLRSIRTKGLLVFEAREILQRGESAQPLTLLKI